jgi:hypothetical protein
MKKLIFLLAACCLFVLIAFIVPQKNIVGTWTITYKDGKTSTIDFRKDGTFKVAIPAEQFTVEGKYKFKDDILSITDSTCGTNYWGKYKGKFMGADSIYSTVIEDSCTGRRMSADKTTLVRTKK